MNTESARILIAIDDSQPSTWAVDVGVALAARIGGSITLVHVVPPPTAGISEGVLVIVDRFGDWIKDRGVAVLKAAARRLPNNCGAATVLRQGPVALEITAQATEMGADFIVMGSHGAGRLSHFILGSATEEVIRQSPCPVVSVSRDPSAVRTVATSIGRIKESIDAGCHTKVTS